MLNCFATNITTATRIVVVTQSDYSAWLQKQKSAVQTWLSASGFRGEPGSVLIPDSSGQLSFVLCCISEKKNFWGVGGLSLTLPEGHYTFDMDDALYTDFAIAWGLGAYQFVHYKKSKRKPAQLVLPKEVDQNHIMNIVESIYLVRTLINIPTENMGPSELADAAVHLGGQHKAKVSQVIGDELLKNNYPTIHAVGRACDDAPRLIDLRWGNKKHPKITLVGKGVCFDTGGLDIKPCAAMLLMKKDMGGAAHVLGLARMIMQAKLPINLRVLIPAVENSISGNAFRPGDVITSRKGTTIEIGNTDAEGRLVLADALTEAVSENPDLILDFATLTGAARIAVGTDIAALFSNHDGVANDLIRHSQQLMDPMWRLPLFTAYRESLNSTIADINNAGIDSYAGAITAALFLKEFVPDTIPWVHFDLMAWNLKSRPGRPQGGEAMAVRAVFSYLVEKFSSI